MNCEICGKQIEHSQYFNADLCSEECFSVKFWNECLDEEAIIINGKCYHDGGKKPKNYQGFLGFDGSTFQIKKKSGEIITTNNLWCEGTIPPDRLVPDNAEFL